MTALVIGANRGIGLALCRELRSRGRQVIACCRRSSEDLGAMGVRVESGVDVTSDDSVADLGKRVAGVAIVELWYNAGILREDKLDGVDLDDVRAQLEVNALGALRVVRELRRGLGHGSKIAVITSRMGSIGDNGSGGYYGYRMSKAALNAAAVSMAKDLSPAGVAVAILHPGYVRTDMTGNHGNIEPAEAARQLVDRMDQLTPERSGTFWHANGQVLPW